MNKEPIIYPINHWSPSSMSQWLTNRLIFKQKYILGIYNDTKGVSATIGSACHYTMKTFYGGNDEIIVDIDDDLAMQTSINAGLDWLAKRSDFLIDFGKTGSRQKMYDTYNKTIRAYLKELPKWPEILSVEEMLKDFIQDENENDLGLPAKGAPDLVVRDFDGKIAIIDHKFVSAYTDEDKDSGKKWLQAMFYYYLVWRKFKEKPARFIFRECKTSTNQDGSKQTKDWGIEYAEAPHYFPVFLNLYKACTDEISRPDVYFLPNFNDLFDGDESFELLKQGLLGTDLSDLEINHQTQTIKYMPKENNFINSVVSEKTNKYLSPSEKIKLKLAEFGIPIKPLEVNIGPSVTQYIFQPSAGVSIKKIKNYIQDISIVLGHENVRLIAPIQGTSNIAIEVPKADDERDLVTLTDNHLTSGTLEIPIGIDMNGKLIKKDIRKMPHLLVGGTTGSGKSVFITTLINSLISQNTENELELYLIDPKRVELSHFADIPHLRGKSIVYEPDQAINVLNNIVNEMENRYEVLKQAKKKDIETYKKAGGIMHNIVIVIDEFADLMLKNKVLKRTEKAEQNYKSMNKDQLRQYALENGMSPWGDKADLIARLEVIETEKAKYLTAEEAICRIAQMARAVGIHLVIATQSPRVNVITGLIKANMPTRVAFMVNSSVDSIVILDQGGAEKLVGRGDLLFQDPSANQLQRLQGIYSE